MSFRVEIFVDTPLNRYRLAQFHYKSDCNFGGTQIPPKLNREAARRIHRQL